MPGDDARDLALFLASLPKLQGNPDAQKSAALQIRERLEDVLIDYDIMSELNRGKTKRRKDIADLAEIRRASVSLRMVIRRQKQRLGANYVSDKANNYTSLRALSSGLRSLGGAARRELASMTKAIDYRPDMQANEWLYAVAIPELGSDLLGLDSRFSRNEATGNTARSPMISFVLAVMSELQRMEEEAATHGGVSKSGTLARTFPILAPETIARAMGRLRGGDQTSRRKEIGQISAEKK